MVQVCEVEMSTNSVFLQTESANNLSEADSSLPHDQEATTSIQSCRCRPGYRARRLKSKGVILVVVWNLLAWGCRSTNMNAEVVSQSLGEKSYFEIVDGMVTAVLYLFAGWLADVYFGRYKVMKVSIWVMWLGSVGGTLLLEFYSLSSVDALKYISVVVAYIGTAIGSSGFIVNAVPFGTDQMLGASSEEISSFIHWFFWAMYTGIASGYFVVNGLHCTGMGDDQALLVSMLFAVAVSSLALCFVETG